MEDKGKDAVVVLQMELRRSAHLHFQAIEPVGWYTTESATHGQCDARPTVTFPASGRYQFILLGKQRHIVSEQLAQSRYVKRSGRDSNLRPLICKSDTLTITPSRHAFTEGGLKFKNLYPGPWPRPSLRVFCHPWDGTYPDLSLYRIW